MRLGGVLAGAAVAVAAALAALQLSGVFEPRTEAQEAAAPATATARAARLIVVPDDNVPGTIARGNPVYEAALAALEAELRQTGFTVQDGRAIPVVNPALDNERRPDAEIAALARRPAPVDAVVLFSLLTIQEFTIQAQNAGIRGTARLLHAADGRSLGNATWASPTRWTVTYACDRACLIDTAASEAPLVGTRIAEQVAAALREAR